MNAATIEPATAAEPLPGDANKHCLADELTARLERLNVVHEPTMILTAEEELPDGQRPSEGHLYSVRYIEPADDDSPFSTSVIWLDDRRGDIAPQLQAELRRISRIYADLADKLNEEITGEPVVARDPHAHDG